MIEITIRKMWWPTVLILHQIIYTVHLCSGVSFHWSSSEHKEQAAKTTCVPFQSYKSVSLKARNHGTNFTKLGKVRDIEVCGLLCCEIESCDLALLDEEFCYAVKCLDIPSCDFTPQGKSEVLTFTRKSGSDIWSSGQRANQNGVNPQNSQSTNSKIVTKYVSVQKSAIPETKTNTNKQEGSFIVLSNKVKDDSPTASHLSNEKDKQNAESKPANKNADQKSAKGNVGEKIQDITDHYLKTEEKSDITALQENDTNTAHSKVQHHHHKDLRHTLISPITIGAFTCMAVIAVSGFAMAIIKYQQDRKEHEDKQTQKS